MVLHGDPVVRFILHQRASDFAGATYDLEQPLRFLLPFSDFGHMVVGVFDVTACQRAYYSYKKQAFILVFALKRNGEMGERVTGSLSFIADPAAEDSSRSH